MNSAANNRFARVLKGRDIFALAFGAMIGWSWVVLAGYWVDTAGSIGVALAFAAGGLVIAFIGLTYSELASAMPKAGGEHVYTHRALGPSWSFVCTWALLFTYIGVCMFEAIALPTAIEYLVPQIRMGSMWQVQGSDVDLGFVIVGVAGASVMAAINVRGIKTAAFVQKVVVGMILLAGLLLATGAVAFGSLDNAEPWLATPATGVLSVLMLVPVLLVGFDVIPQSAEEIDLPAKRIGKLLVISVLIAIAWYIGVSLAVAVALPRGELAASAMATGDAATALWGNSWAGTALVLGGIGGILTSWNAFIVGGSRLLFALGESGQLPAAFSRLHPRYKTPHVAVITIGILSCLAPLFGREVLVWIANATSFSVVIAYLFVAIAFLVLRRSEPQLPRPFEVKYPRLIGYGAVVLACALLAVYLPWSPSALIWPYEWGMLLVWAVIGLVFFVRARHTWRQVGEIGG